MNPQHSPAAGTDPNNQFITDLGPAQTAEPTTEVTSTTGKTVTVGQIGKSGTYLFNGIITREDYNPEMQRWELLKNIDIMRRSDATVQALLTVIKQPLLSAAWTIVPGGEDAKDVEIADWTRFNLFDNEITFSDLLEEIMTYKEFGYSVFEKVWDYVKWHDTEMIGLTGLQSRKQRSIYRWQTTDATPRFGITQYVPGGTYSVPGEKLVVFTNKKEGDNHEGISMLRPGYKHWKIKDSLELIEAIRHERQGLGVIKIIPPVGANEDDVDEAIINARQARASEEGVIKHPDGWEIEFMDMKGGTAQNTDIQATLQYHTRQILLSCLAQFLDFGGSKNASGSRATSADHSALFELAEEFTAKYIEQVINRHVIRELVDLNYTGVENYPKLEHSKIGDDNIVQVGEFISTLMTSGAVTPDAGLEQWLRQLAHAPEMPEDMAKGYDDLPARQKPEPVVPAPAAPAPATKDDGAADAQTKTADDAVRMIKQGKAKLIDTLLN